MRQESEDGISLRVFRRADVFYGTDPDVSHLATFFVAASRQNKTILNLRRFYAKMHPAYCFFA